MRRNCALIAAIAVALVLVCAQGLSAQAPASFSTIVVFDEYTNLDPYTPEYVPDDRAAANPRAWGYLNKGVAGYVQHLEKRHGFKAEHVYSAAIRGFSARLNPQQLVAIQSEFAVKRLETDGVMNIIDNPKNDGKPSGGGGGGEPAEVTPWGITKVGGGGQVGAVVVNAYIIDTGIDETHPDLKVAGPVTRAVNFAGGVNTDCNGHGTHVAGTVAAIDNTIDVVGVAPGISLYAVKVLGCGGSGTTSGVIKGVDWVTANAVKPAVANMSLGGSASTSLDTAVRNSAANGIFYAVAAGNSGADACNSSPAGAAQGTLGIGIMAVGATDSNDQAASWSNYGSCVEIWAPGVSILSTKKGGGTTPMSGTSMASPHVAGGAARFLASGAGSTPGAVETGLLNTAQDAHRGLTVIKRLYVHAY